VPRAVPQRLPEIEVGLTGEGADVRPDWVERRGEKLSITDVLATWVEGGQGPAGRTFNRLNRTYFRVRTQGGAVLEIAHEQPEARKSGARWVLIRELPGQTPEEPSSAAQSAQPRGEIRPAEAQTAPKPPAKRTAAGGTTAAPKAPARRKAPKAGS
jgi:hypothetical protein